MPPNSELITVERDCEAILIPSGDPIKLIKGTHVRITQALGGDYTLFVNGNLVKISGTDADAIGKDPEEEKSDVPKTTGEPVQEEQVWEQLRTVYDPEIPVNIVDLDALTLGDPERVHDLPTGAARLVQRASGCRATIVGGEVTFRESADTGARPGALIRRSG